MAITTFLNQYANGELRAAYQNSYVTAGNASNPVVYYDVYINGNYYRTITTTTVWQTIINSSYYRVDIKDVVQEYLRSPPPNLVDMHASPYLQYPTTSICQVFVRVRGSSMVSGVLVPDGTAPIQGTATTSAVPGTGLQTNTWYFVHATLQYDGEQKLRTYINSITIPPPTGPTSVFSLSPRQKTDVGLQDFGWWPVLNANTSNWNSLHLEIYDGDIFYQPANYDTFFINSMNIAYVPIGPENYRQMSNGASVPFASMNRYQVILMNGLFQMVWVSPIIYLKKCKTEKRIYFMNYLGHFEPVSFHTWEAFNRVTSEQWERPLANEPFMNRKSQDGTMRFNVRSFKEFTVYAEFAEKDYMLVEELQATPTAYLEFKDPNQTKAGLSYNADLVPIRILDVDVVTRKTDGRFYYEVALKYVHSHSTIHPRN